MSSRNQQNNVPSQDQLVEQNFKDTLQTTAAQQELGYGQGVSGAGGISQLFERSKAGHTKKEVTFSRTYIHFLGPGTEGAGLGTETDDDGRLCYSYDFGASFLPYAYTRAAVKPRHLWKYMQNCNSYRILSHEAVLSDLICSRDEIQADGRIVTTPQADCIEIFEDNQGKFRPSNVVLIGAKNLFEINSGFRRIQPEDIDEGTLPRAKIRLPAEQYMNLLKVKLIMI